VHQHTLRLEQLQQLAQSPELQVMLKDERLQQLMLKIDGGGDREQVGRCAGPGSSCKGLAAGDWRRRSLSAAGGPQQRGVPAAGGAGEDGRCGWRAAPAGGLVDAAACAAPQALELALQQADFRVVADKVGAGASRGPGPRACACACARACPPLLLLGCCCSDAAWLPKLGQCKAPPALSAGGVCRGSVR
jgi:hypothetical protein